MNKYHWADGVVMPMSNVTDQDFLPLPAVEHYSDQWADGYRAGLQDVLNYLKAEGKQNIVQWTEGMLSALTQSKP